MDCVPLKSDRSIIVDLKPKCKSQKTVLIRSSCGAETYTLSDRYIKYPQQAELQWSMSKPPGNETLDFRNLLTSVVGKNFHSRIQDKRRKSDKIPVSRYFDHF